MAAIVSSEIREYRHNISGTAGARMRGEILIKEFQVTECLVTIGII
jgi:hypothetical protein